jgi:uncharacterized protein YndB with AHSA1/START domain
MAKTKAKAKPQNATEEKPRTKERYLKYEMEYPIHASKGSLYNLLSSAGGLAMWFADDVNLKGTAFEFIWEDNKQQAEVLAKKENQYIRFKWKHEPEYTYFEFRISVDELTGDVALVITDFAEDTQAVDNAKLLWQNQVKDLHHALGAN